MSIFQNEKALINFIRYGAIILIIIISFIITKIFISHEKNRLKNDIQFIEKNYITNHKIMIENLVNKIHNIIKVEKENAEIDLKKKIKKEVYQAHKIATTIYNHNIKKSSYSKEKTINEIKRALRSISFNKGNGYIFIDAINGETILNKIKEFEGSNLLEFKDAKGYKFIKTIVKTIKDKTERFDEYFWYKGTDKTKSFKKIAFYKYFEPYNFAIGSGDYIDDFELNLQKKVLRKLNSLKFKKPEHLFIYDSKGLCLVNPKKDLIGINRYNSQNKDGKYVLREVLKYVLKNKNGFVQYKGSVILNKTNITNDKISFVRLFEDWQWMIGSGFYLEEMYNRIEEKKVFLKESNNKAIKELLIASIIITLIIIIISFYLSIIFHRIFKHYKSTLQKKEKEKEKELMRSARLYKDLFKTNKSIILLINPENGDIVNANDCAFDFYGYSKEKLLSMNISDINKLSKKELQKELDNAKELKRNYFNFIHKLSNGVLKHVRVTSSIANYFDKEVLFSVINDSTKEHEIQNELEQSEQEFKALFEFSNIGLGIRNIDGEFIKINPKLIKMLGYKEEYLLNKNCIHISTNENLEEEIRIFKKLINKEIKNYNIEKTYVRKDGTRFEAILTMASITNIEGEITNILSSIIDVSEMKEKDRLLIQQSKMATMGEMIGNIAHQWKQPLSLISMSNGLVKLNQEDHTFSTQEELNEAIENIDNSVQHLSSTIDDFRNFFRPDKEKLFFNLRIAYDKTYNLIESQLKNNNIYIIDDINDIEIYGYQNELLQVLINIIKNSKDELIKLPRDKKRLIFIKMYEKDSEVVIKIKDNAGGIPNDIIDKIFNAYFTTKQSSEGTGIGLYMSKQIIGGMDGIIEVSNIHYEYENIKYNGAKFIIRIPL